MSDTSYETDRIEQDLDRTRARLDATIGALQDKLSPGQLLDQGLAYLKDSGGSEFARNLGYNVKANPMPVALVATGIAWLMMGGSREQQQTSRYEDYYEDDLSTGPSLYERAHTAATGVTRLEDETSEAYEDRVQEARAAAVGLRRRAGETARGFADRIEHTLHMAQRGASRLMHGAGRMAEGVGSMAGSAAHGAGRMAQGVGSMAGGAVHGVGEGGSRAFAYLQNQPLLLGALGVSVGALLASIVPASRQEEEILGGVREDLREQVKEAAGSVMEEGRRVAGEVMQAAGEAAERAGLTQEELQRKMEAGAAAVGDMAERTRQVVEETAAASRESVSGAADEGSRRDIAQPARDESRQSTGELPRADRIGLCSERPTLPG